MDWITEQIAIGNYLDARSLPSEIGAVLCLKEGCCETRDDVDALCVPLVDGAGNDGRLICEAVTYLSDMVDVGARVLVYCHAGRSRSVAIVARYLMDKRSITSQAALELIASRRSVYLSDGIDEILFGRIR